MAFKAGSSIKEQKKSRKEQKVKEKTLFGNALTLTALGLFSEKTLFSALLF